MASPKVSIIIPTYNRAILIGDTLESIKKQSFEDWECIVIDDGSTDDTKEILKEYSAVDGRFIYETRPPEKPKGANACRNIGLEKASGQYIVFFDSDDLMTEDHIRSKFNKLQEGYDYVIAKTRFFNSDKSLDYYYNFSKYPISAHNYIAQKNNWLTLDIGLKGELARSIRFNEELQSGQEFNFFCKLVLISTHAVFIDKEISLRRDHEDSIRGMLNKDVVKRANSQFLSKWATYIEVGYKMKRHTRKALLLQVVSNLVKARQYHWSKAYELNKAIFRDFGVSGIQLSLAMLSSRYLHKGYFLIKRVAKAHGLN